MIQPTTYSPRQRRAAGGVEHAAAVVGDHAAALVERHAGQRDAAVADRAEHEPRGDRLALARWARARRRAVRRRRRARCGRARRRRDGRARRPSSATGESRKRRTMRLACPPGARSRVGAQDLDVAPRGRCCPRRPGRATASARSSSAGSTITSASASSPSSSSSGFVKAACAGPRRPTTTTSDTRLAASTSSAWSAVSVGASSAGVEHEHARDVERDVAVADHDGALGREQVDLEVGVVGVAVVPADELGGRVRAGELFAGDARAAGPTGEPVA